jgi:hypothetical protein
MAVLTFNLFSYIGNDVSKWNCTEVYRLECDGQWKIVHTHWSITNRMLNECVPAIQRMNGFTA